MVNALINLSDKTNRILNIVKSIHNFKDKGEAIDYVISRYANIENKEIFSQILTKEDILSRLENKSEKLKKLGVTKLALFGSYLHGDATSQSDIDFLLELKENDLGMYVDVKEFLSKLFEKNIDLVFESTLRPELKKIKDEAIYVKGL